MIVARSEYISPFLISSLARPRNLFGMLPIRSANSSF